MKHLTPQLIADITGGVYVGGEKARNARIAGAVRDNRDVRQGNLFVCIRGARADGHSFANSAFESGAACCLAERPIPDAKGPLVLVDSTLEAIKTVGAYHRNLFDIPVIGISGSVGKTTTKELVAAALSVKLEVLKTAANLNNELGVPLMLMSIDERHEAAVIEMGISDFGEMSRLAEMVRPDIFVLTNIGYSHLLELGDLNGVFRAKTEAFAYMKPGGVAVLCGDDDMLYKCDPGMRKITFGLDARNDFYADNVRQEDAGVYFDIVSDKGRYPARIPAYGSHLPSLAPAAAAIGRLLGVKDEEISRGLESYLPVGGRANIADTGEIVLIDDCYNANPNSVKAALVSLKTLPGRHVVILGDMINLGTDSEKLHRDIGAYAALSGLNSLICCGNEASFIHKGYKSAGGNDAHYYPAKADLIPMLSGHIKKGDAVLVKASRGMHFEEVVSALKDIRILP